MNVLEIAQSAARLLSVSVPSSMVNSNNNNALLLLEVLARSCQERSREHAWPQLIRQHTLTLTNGGHNYELPEDFLGWINTTNYDVDNQRPLEGPVHNSRWASLRYGIVNRGPYEQFRISGIYPHLIQITPIPGASDVGREFTFGYLSKSCFRPALWESNKVYSANAYVSNSNIGYIYRTPDGGTSGTVQPFHNSGQAGDGGMTWAYHAGAYDRPTADTDEPVFDSDLVIDDLVWRYKQHRGLDYMDLKRDADRKWKNHFAKFKGGSIVNMGQNPEDTFLINLNNVPDTGYGL